MGRNKLLKNRENDLPTEEIEDPVDTATSQALFDEEEQYAYVCTVSDIQDEILKYREHVSIPICEYMTVDAIFEFIDSLYTN